MPDPQFEILSAFLPPESLPGVIDLLTRWKFDLKITRKRRSKVGDYRPPYKGKGHQVSVNHDLNPYAFLLTLIHEIAHLVVHESYRRRMQPHGKEWKTAYRELLEPFYEQNVFPDDIRQAIDHYFNRLSESNRSDLELNLVLKKYDQDNGMILVQELPEKSLFRSQRGQVSEKDPVCASVLCAAVSTINVTTWYRHLWKFILFIFSIVWYSRKISKFASLFLSLKKHFYYE